MSSKQSCCGRSDQRNKIYTKKWSVKKFYHQLVKNSKPTIIDIGAHRGESATLFQKIFPDCTLYSFEPNPNNFKYLKGKTDQINLRKKLYSRLGFAEALQYALAEKKGKMPFFMQSISHLGGLLAVNKKSKDSLGYAKNAQNKKVKVNTISLDDFCSQRQIDAIDVLKIDTQGFELFVLKGARKILKQTVLCSVEVSFYDFYKKASSLYEVEKIMHLAGLRLFDIAKISKNPKNFRTDWAELIYVKDKR